MKEIKRGKVGTANNSYRKKGPIMWGVQTRSHAFNLGERTTIKRGAIKDTILHSGTLKKLGQGLVSTWGIEEEKTKKKRGEPSTKK